MKRLIVNCGHAVLLKDSEGVLGDLKEMNAGTIIVSTDIHAEMIKNGVEVNCGRMQTVKAPEKPVFLQSNAVLDGSADYEGCYLICEGSLIITPDGVSKVAGLDGVFVAGTLFYPKSAAGGALSGIRADTTVSYPDKAHVKVGDFRLTQYSVSELEPSKEAFIEQTLYALEEEGLREAAARGITFSGKKTDNIRKLLQKIWDSFLHGCNSGSGRLQGS